MFKENLFRNTFLVFVALFFVYSLIFFIKAVLDPTLCEVDDELSIKGIWMFIKFVGWAAIMISGVLFIFLYWVHTVVETNRKETEEFTRKFKS